jgi:S-adenosylmethionine hydrolase
VHVGVVDPGVGTDRRPIAVAAGDSVLVGPDNGLLLPAAEALGGVDAVHELANTDLWRHPVSATFHGRDIFSPVAAHLASGVVLDDLRVEAEVVTVDRFGNAQFGCPAPQRWRRGQELTVETDVAVMTATLERTFAAVAPGSLVAFVDSAGLLALGVNGGRASDRLGLAPGVIVRLSPKEQ